MKNARLLNKIYRNSRTSMEAISEVMPSVSSEDMARVLKKQKNKYQKIAKEASDSLGELDRLPDEEGIFEKIGFSLTFRFGILRDKSEPNLASVLIEGCNGGIGDIRGELNAQENYKTECINLAEILIETEEEMIRDLQRFL